MNSSASTLFIVAIIFSALQASALFGTTVENHLKRETISGSINAGQSQYIEFVAYSGRSYDISVVKHRKSLHPMFFQIIDTMTDEVVFDSTPDSTSLRSSKRPRLKMNRPSYSFDCELTRKFIICISASAAGTSELVVSDNKSTPADASNEWKAIVLENSAGLKVSMP